MSHTVMLVMQGRRQGGAKGAIAPSPEIFSVTTNLYIIPSSRCVQAKAHPGVTVPWLYAPTTLDHSIINKIKSF